MFINEKNHFSDYLQILYKNKEDVHFISRIQIVDNMMSFESFSKMSEEEKERFLDYTSFYWFKSDLYENTLFDICWLVNEYKLYKITNFCDFERKLDELI